VTWHAIPYEVVQFIKPPMHKRPSAHSDASAASERRHSRDTKQADLLKNTTHGTDQVLTSNEGLSINDDQNSLKAGLRGPTLLEDHLLREKITHFDHERIPERAVHARGSAAHGYFQVYTSQSALTKAGFLNDPSLKTPVFVRFSTVAGSRGSGDLARDARGFAVKFYTEEGNYDLVGRCSSSRTLSSSRTSCTP
jgi:catalase